MKKTSFLAIFIFLGVNFASAQQNYLLDIESSVSNVKRDSFWNNLSYEIAYGYALPVSPSDNLKISDYSSLVNFQVGANYMFNDQYGLRLTYAYHNFANKNESKFGVVYNKVMLEGTLSVMNSISYSRNETFDVIVHGGFGGTFTKSKFDKSNEKMLNIQLGAKPTYQLNNQSAIFVDISGIANFSQDIAYNGLRTGEFNKKTTGFYLSAMVGYQFRIGK